MAVLNLARMRRHLHAVVVKLRRAYFRKVWGMQIGEGTRISLSVRLDKTNPKGVQIGDYTALTFGVAVLTHDYVNRRHVPTRIGSYCFIGCNSVIMPGVTIGDHCIIGAGSVVMRDVPPNSVASGNPARVLERDIETIAYGVRLSAAIPAEAAVAEERRRLRLDRAAAAREPPARDADKQAGAEVAEPAGNAQ